MRDELKKLELSIEILEKKIEKFDIDLKEKFIGEVLFRFNDLLEERANRLSYSLKNSLFEKNDIKQEFILYILKYNYSEVKRRMISEGKIWIPYLKNSIRNCSVNLIKKYGRNTKRNPISEISRLDDLPEEIFSCSNFINYEFLFSDFGYLILKKLNRIERLLFLSLIYPSINLRKYLRKKKIKMSQTSLSHYFNIPYSAVGKSFKNIKSTFISVVDYG